MPSLRKQISSSVARKSRFASVHKVNRVEQAEWRGCTNLPSTLQPKTPTSWQICQRIAYDVRQPCACITNHPDTAMTMRDIPCVVNTTLHQASLANTKVAFQVLEFPPQREYF
jgi:hypothetical protein